MLTRINELHTTPMGVERIKRNLSIEDDPVQWCRAAITSPGAEIHRQGKNYYITAKGAVITVNAHSFTIITAHRIKEKI